MTANGTQERTEGHIVGRLSLTDVCGWQDVALLIDAAFLIHKSFPEKAVGILRPRPHI